jgi:PST family polysaccharide transporter
MREFLLTGGRVLLLTNVFYALNFLGNLALVRLLSPDAFGTVALALALSGLVEMGTTFSLNTVYLQRRSTPSLLATVIQLIGAIVVLKIVVTMLVYVIGKNQYEQQIWMFFAIISLSKLSIPISALLMSIMDRELRFVRSTAIYNASGTVGVIFAVLAAAAGAGVYSLLVREVLPLFLRLGGAVYFSRHLRIEWWKVNKRQMKLVARASLEMFGQRAADLGYLKLPALFVEAWFGVAVLGMLNQALYLVNFTNRMTNVVNQQMGTVYFSRFRKDARKTKEGWAMMLALTLALGLPFAALLYFFPAQVVSLLWGQHWLPAVPIVKSIAAVAILLPVLTIMKSQLLGLRKTNTITLASVAGTIVFIGLMILPYADAAGLALVGAAATISYVVMIAISYQGLASFRLPASRRANAVSG